MKPCVNNYFNCFSKIPKALFLQMLLHILFTIQLTYAQRETGSFKFDGITRNYEVYLPQNFQANMPLVIAFHGWSETIHWFKTYTVLHQFADTAGFIVVYPKGIDRSWNVGIKYCPIRSPFPTVDDVGFISALIDRLYNRYTNDIQRIYCCGFSTGGAMTYRLACELGERIAAVAVVGANLFDAAENWQPIKATPVLHIHGTKDLYAPYFGPGTIPTSTTDEEWSVKKTLDYWIERKQCSSIGDTIALPDLVPGDSCTVQKVTFSECSYNTEVIHFKIIGGGHAWPGSPTKVPFYANEGNRNMDINANEEIWNFFKNYELVTSIETIASSTPREFCLFQNYPNPFNPTTNIEFNLNKTSQVTLKIFNILRKEVATLVSDRLNAGSYNYEWDASNLASGIYLYRLEACAFTQMNKMLLLK